MIFITDLGSQFSTLRYMYIEDLSTLAKENDYFRHVLYTRMHSQIVVMSLLPNEDIGLETHPTSDQILYIITGAGQATVDGERKEIHEGSVIYVPAGT